MRISAGPCSSPPSAETMSASVTGAITARLARREGSAPGGRGVQGLDHLFGDVDARPGEDDVLQDQVVLLAVKNLLDDLVGALDEAGRLFVAALVQVFLEFPALALQVTVGFDQFALAAVALGFGQRGGVFLEL